MVDVWKEPKLPSDVDRYNFVISESWLNGESISSALWSVKAGSELTISSETIDVNKLSALISNGVTGTHGVFVDVTTPTRKKMFRSDLMVRDIS